VLADGRTFVWAPGGGPVSYSIDFGATWIASAGTPSGASVVADKVSPKKAYLFVPGAGTVYVSSDGGATFSAAATGMPTSGTLSTVYGQPGDLWLASGSGLYHSLDGGATFVQLAGVQSAIAVGSGKPAPGRRYPALYMIGALQPNEQAIFRSDDAGRTWDRINDDRHQFGTQQVISGDPRVYGRVYLGTNGRGVLFGDPAW
jgi:xyloglucan-specific exo-beta-1,4-glucanase